MKSELDYLTLLSPWMVGMQVLDSSLIGFRMIQCITLRV